MPRRKQTKRPKPESAAQVERPADGGPDPSAISTPANDDERTPAVADRTPQEPSNGPSAGGVTLPAGLAEAARDPDWREKLTPAMRQYVDVRETYPFPEYTLLFQMGDFYEVFFEDAERTAIDLGLTLTKRGKIGEFNVPLSGFPLRSLETHCRKLMRKGRRR